jgi:hypothetical protein
MGTDCPRRNAETAGLHRCEQRPAKCRSTSITDLRPADRSTLRYLSATNRRRALRRLWPAAGLSHVCFAQPIPCGDGSGSAVLAKSDRTGCNLHSAKHDSSERGPSPSPSPTPAGGDTSSSHFRFSVCSCTDAYSCTPQLPAPPRRLGPLPRLPRRAYFPVLYLLLHLSPFLRHRPPL